MPSEHAIHQARGQVLSNTNLAQDVFVLRVFCPEIARAARPGQFVHVRCGTDREFILRRPFSVHRVTGDNAIELLVRTVGKGTRYLAGLNQQAPVDMLGPLGTPFDIPDGTNRALIVAGGMGIAPIMFLAEELIARRIRVYSVLGARTRDELFYYMDFKRMGRDVYVSTDDGSQGQCGVASDLVPQAIEDCAPDVVYACGPEPMLQAVADFARTYQVRCQVSMEALMACGIGACLSCARETVDGPVRVCVEGPVFDAADMVWRD